MLTLRVVTLVFALFETAILSRTVKASAVSEAASSFRRDIATSRLVWSSAVRSVADILTALIGASFCVDHSALAVL